MRSKKLHRWYKEVLSGYKAPLKPPHSPTHTTSGKLCRKPLSDQGKPSLKAPILKKENMGTTLCIDEKNIAGECYTIVSNPETNKIILMANTLRSSEIVHLLRTHIPLEDRYAVSSVARDMTQNYDWGARELFPNAYQVADKFHVVKSIIEQVQSARIRHRQELRKKQRELEASKRRESQKKSNPEIQRELKDLQRELPNGDTLLQLLQRSKGLLHTMPDKHTASQKLRAKQLFKLFPEIKDTYDFSAALRQWYQQPKKRKKSIAPSRELWEQKRKELITLIAKHTQGQNDEVMNIAHFLLRHLGEICNYFLGYRTNASAEALNQNLQRFISVNYGARNKDFFLYRIAVHYS